MDTRPTGSPPPPHRGTGRSRRGALPAGGLLLVGAAAALGWAAHTRSTAPSNPVPPAGAPPAASGPASPARADLSEVVLTLRGGRIVQGLLVDDSPSGLVVRTEGIDTSFARRDVASVRVLPPVRDRYRAMRQAIEPGDVDAMVFLAEWLRDRGLYAEALTELGPVLELEPFNTRARDLRRWLTSQIELESRPTASRPARQAPADAEPEQRPAPAQRRARPAPADQFPTLTPEQINVIRVYEVDLADPPRMRVDRQVVEDLLRAYASSDQVPATRAQRERLLSAPPADILRLMFRLQAREFYPRVQVLEDPRAIELFKDNIHGFGGWLTNACATTRCHGGAEAGRLYLNARRPNSDATTYTNLLILDRFRLADGTPLIDYERPARSPLLHMGLLRDVSLYPHPEVGARGGPGWRPVFRGTDDRQFQRAVEWITAMYRPRIGYPIQYTPPAPPMPDAEPADADQAQPPQGTASAPVGAIPPGPRPPERADDEDETPIPPPRP